MFEDAVSTT